MNEFETKQFEARLTRALQRVDSPEGFADSVMQKIAVEPRRKVFVMSPRTSTWVTGAIAAVLALGIFTGERVHEYHERQLANQQFETATRITDQALAHAREQLQRAGVPLD
ncbi:hypothetical protein GOB94_08520 [Granulicella sp. 5B5]|uniref:hypothetical protein n=1 Tax=Granulicella sp. 5B5 TaxID=1617967 RepID=UPI0015F4149E|nr:hypothetical protein [Granulicella sp. 5B5]QMV18719.1 hypothetical protein GOB94_08520 [Granulicella sp. 5B5]